MSPLRLGTCAFTAPGWPGSFYPKGLSSKEFLRFYAEELSTVELDVTWYRTPTPEMIAAWYAKTPPGFVFAAKVPQTITHDKVLEGCAAEMREFLAAMRGLREKLGPLLLQFPHFSRGYFATLAQFLDVLEPFLDALPRDLKFAVEVRNETWANQRLLDVLRARNVAFAWTDRAGMTPPRQFASQLDPVTADFTYIRWLGDRKLIETITKSWDRTVVDRTAEITDWAELLTELRRREIAVYGYVNNHYGGHAPDTVRALLDLVAPEQRKRRPPQYEQRGLF
ncbi:MAG: DUF72 domain-containing protein [Bryobacterales bacterium]|nr:DUF72 domain-containing protein [Bryobacterales bacterium]